jgi:hypothetical protein
MTTALASILLAILLVLVVTCAGVWSVYRLIKRLSLVVTSYENRPWRDTKKSQAPKPGEFYR